MNQTVKDRGLDAPGASGEDTKEVCTKTFINQGTKIKLADGRVWTVKDIPLDAWLTSIGDTLPLLMQFADSYSNETELIIGLASQPELRNAIYNLTAQATVEASLEDIKKLSLPDALKLWTIVKETVNFTEIKELFTQLVSGIKLPSSTGSNEKPPVKKA